MRSILRRRSEVRSSRLWAANPRIEGIEQVLKSSSRLKSSHRRLCRRTRTRSNRLRALGGAKSAAGRSGNSNLEGFVARRDCDGRCRDRVRRRFNPEKKKTMSATETYEPA